MNPKSTHTNRLIKEKSPYLLQHAHNPVDWYPWGSEAFETAQRDNKLIFLSIGYSTCHWCHVMEQESFEDLEVAKLLNETFIAIKVDREERPDIDQIYMDVCQAITGSGGWPLTIIMTPDKKPFFAATYIPKKARFGRIGFMELIPQIRDYWLNRRQEVLNSAEEVIHAIQESPSSKGLKISEKEILELAFTQLSNRFDREEGGFSDAPKFPTPHIILFLLRYWKRTRNANALHMVEKTLQAMRRGGIFDHIGFGFHRYSTDFFWLVPHFEKMLYDQALMVMVYTEAFEATRKEEYSTNAREILTYVLRDMTAPEGGFYSAEDADSKDEAGVLGEGKFYVWKEAELKSLLNHEEFELAVKVFDIKKKGNFLEQTTQEQTGENILHQIKSGSEIAAELNMSLEELKEKIEAIRKQMFEAREKRAHPQKDDKVLTDWNGLMVAAFAKAARTTNEPTYTAASKRAIDFILKKMRRADGRLLHRYRNGEAAILANLEDYAFLIWGLLEMYQTTFDAKYLQEALKLNEEMLDFFWDAQNGGFFFTPRDGEPLLFRKKDIYDGAIPSGNSVAMWDLLHLEKITGKTELAEKAMQIVQAFSAEVTKGPAALTQLMVALEFAIGPSFEIVIAGNPLSEDTKNMIKALRSQFLPNLVLLINPINQPLPLIQKVAPSLKDQQSIQGKATAYVCIGKTCKAPVTDVNALLNAVTTKPD